MAKSKKPPADVARQDPGGILQRTFDAIVDSVAGLSDSSNGSRIRSAGRILQGAVSLRFLDALKEEFERYRELGRIKDDYAGCPQSTECLQELLEFLDGECPDERRFECLKRILLVAATEEVASRQSVLPQQYMRVVRNLTSGEVLVLLATHSIAKRGFEPDESASEWLSNVAQQAGLKHRELVEIHEERLMASRLLSARQHRDKSGVALSNRYRLTGLAWDICEFIGGAAPDALPDDGRRSCESPT